MIYYQGPLFHQLFSPFSFSPTISFILLLFSSTLHLYISLSPPSPTTPAPHAVLVFLENIEFLQGGCEAVSALLQPCGGHLQGVGRALARVPGVHVIQGGRLASLGNGVSITTVTLFYNILVV